MTQTEELFLDEDGIPILTDTVHDMDEPGETEPHLASPVQVMEPRDIANAMLGNDLFRRHLESVAAALTHNVCQQMERALQPILEEAITLALNNSSENSYEAVRLQLESSLPELVADALQDHNEKPE